MTGSDQSNSLLTHIKNTLPRLAKATMDRATAGLKLLRAGHVNLRVLATVLGILASGIAIYSFFAERRDERLDNVQRTLTELKPALKRQADTTSMDYERKARDYMDRGDEAFADKNWHKGETLYRKSMISRTHVARLCKRSAC